MQIYLHINDQQAGPYSLDQIQSFIADGQITPEALAWSEGMTAWVPVKDITVQTPKAPPIRQLSVIEPLRQYIELSSQPSSDHSLMTSSTEIANGCPALEKAFKHLTSVLVANEKVEALAIQRRLRALNHRRVVVAVTTGRFIVIRRGLLSGFKMGDVRWQDMHDSKIEVGIFSATIKVLFAGMADMSLCSVKPGSAVIEGLEKDQAQAIYRICQAQDQAWREKRRIREMEELRSKSGGFQMPSSISNSLNSDSMGRLHQAKQMLDARLITDSEYEAMKAKIISNV